MKVSIYLYYTADRFYDDLVGPVIKFPLPRLYTHELNEKMITNDGKERIWKITVVVYFKKLPRHSSREIAESRETL
jgi:hypothetical protein